MTEEEEEEEEEGAAVLAQAPAIVGDAWQSLSNLLRLFEHRVGSTRIRALGAHVQTQDRLRLFCPEASCQGRPIGEPGERG